jgi:hypothetical protein
MGLAVKGKITAAAGGGIHGGRPVLAAARRLLVGG